MKTIQEFLESIQRKDRSVQIKAVKSYVLEIRWRIKDLDAIGDQNQQALDRIELALFSHQLVEKIELKLAVKNLKQLMRYVHPDKMDEEIYSDILPLLLELKTVFQKNLHQQTDLEERSKNLLDLNGIDFDGDLFVTMQQLEEKCYYALQAHGESIDMKMLDNLVRTYGHILTSLINWGVVYEKEWILDHAAAIEEHCKKVTSCVKKVGLLEHFVEAIVIGVYIGESGGLASKISSMLATFFSEKSTAEKSNFNVERGVQSLRTKIEQRISRDAVDTEQQNAFYQTGQKFAESALILSGMKPAVYAMYGACTALPALFFGTAEVAATTSVAAGVTTTLSGPLGWSLLATVIFVSAKRVLDHQAAEKEKNRRPVYEDKMKKSIGYFQTTFTQLEKELWNKKYRKERGNQSKLWVEILNRGILDQCKNLEALAQTRELSEDEQKLLGILAKECEHIQTLPKHPYFSDQEVKTLNKLGFDVADIIDEADVQLIRKDILPQGALSAEDAEFFAAYRDGKERQLMLMAGPANHFSAASEEEPLSDSSQPVKKSGTY